MRKRIYSVATEAAAAVGGGRGGGGSYASVEKVIS